MTKASDKANDQDENNDSLVMALESIKSLLATSEKRRAQVDEEGTDMAETRQAEAEDASETEVPVLEDIIIPGRPAPGKATQGQDEQAAETNPVAQAEIDADELLAFQLQLEQELHDRLSNYAGQLEHELKEKIAAFVQQQLKE